ncbi:MAG: N-acetylmuramoyl-L-alanine amidase [Sandaracinaceae bacterium]
MTDDLSARPSYLSAAGLGVLVLALASCGSSGELDAPDPTPAPRAPVVPPSAEQAWAMPLPELRETVSALGAEVTRTAGTEEGVAVAVGAAEAARVLALRDPDGADWIAHARAWLHEASRRRELTGACEAALDLLALESRDAADLEAAYRVAFRTTLRFGGRNETCVDRAQRALTQLEPWRPSAGELAAIRADPDADDPSVRAAAQAAQDPIERWASENADDAERATLESLTVYGHGAGDQERADAVRVVLRFDRVVAFEHGEAPAEDGRPARTWFELAAVGPGPSVATSMPIEEGGLTRVRTSSHARGMRVSFDLAEGARFRAFAMEEPFRIVLDIERGGPRAAGPVRTVLLDPGHGGDDFGARAFGQREARLVLDIATRTRDALRARMPEARVLMTRETDDFVSLEQRTAMANAVGADVFVSIHLNAADEPVSRGGVTTFVLDTSGDAQAARLAARENGTTPGQVGSLATLLAQMHREDQSVASRALAEQVHRSTLAAGRTRLPGLHDRGVRSALFYVLVGARMPAVLVEASFLSREDEATALQEEGYRQRLAEGIAEGIARWAGG